MGRDDGQYKVRHVQMLSCKRKSCKNLNEGGCEIQITYKRSCLHHSMPSLFTSSWVQCTYCCAKLTKQGTSVNKACYVTSQCSLIPFPPPALQLEVRMPNYQFKFHSNIVQSVAQANYFLLAGPHWSMLLGPHWNILAGPHWNMLPGPHWNMLAGPHWNMLVGPHWSMLAGPHWNMLAGPHWNMPAGPHWSMLAGPHWNMLAGPHWNMLVTSANSHQCMWS